jgi:hypothetical protein
VPARPRLRFEPPAIDFTDVAPDTVSEARVVVIENVGGAPTGLVEVTVPRGFGVAEAPGGAALRAFTDIDAGETRVVEVRCEMGTSLEGHHGELALAYAGRRSVVMLSCRPPVDVDGDGTPNDADCAPFAPDVHPGATEVCNGIDDNCDGTVDGAVCTPVSVDPAVVDFGVVGLFEPPRARTVRLRNTGPVAVKVIVETGGDMGAEPLGVRPQRVFMRAGGERDVDVTLPTWRVPPRLERPHVTLAPQGRGMLATVLPIDVVIAPDWFLLHGGRPARDVALDAAGVAHIDVYNPFWERFAITRIAVEGPDAALFRVATDGARLPGVRVAQGGTAGLTVTIDATRLARHRASWRCAWPGRCRVRAVLVVSTTHGTKSVALGAELAAP